MDGQRLHADAGRFPPARGVTRRPLRAPARVHDRGGVVRAGLPALRAVAQRRVPDRRASPAGRRRGPADPGEPGHHRGELPSPGPGRGHRGVVRPGRRRGRHRPVSRGMADLVRVVAPHLLHQPAPGRRRALGLRAPRPREPRPERAGPPAGPGRVGAHRARARRRHLRPHRGPGRRLGSPRRWSSWGCWAWPPSPASCWWSGGAATPWCRWTCSARCSSARPTSSPSWSTPPSAARSSCSRCSSRSPWATRRSRPGPPSSRSP